jgi:hypothetical protein
MIEKTKPTVRITDQYRDRDAMAYELLCEGTRVVIRFQEDTSGDGPRWRAEARVNDKSDDSVIEASGATRAEALQKIGEGWDATLRSRPIPAFDWTHVADALRAVKAL